MPAARQLRLADVGGGGDRRARRAVAPLLFAQLGRAEAVAVRRGMWMSVGTRA